MWRGSLTSSHEGLIYLSMLTVWHWCQNLAVCLMTLTHCSPLLCPFSGMGLNFLGISHPADLKCSLSVRTEAIEYTGTGTALQFYSWEHQLDRTRYTLVLHNSNSHDPSAHHEIPLCPLSLRVAYPRKCNIKADFLNIFLSNVMLFYTRMQLHSVNRQNTLCYHRKEWIPKNQWLKTLYVDYLLCARHVAFLPVEWTQIKKMSHYDELNFNLLPWPLTFDDSVL